MSFNSSVTKITTDFQETLKVTKGRVEASVKIYLGKQAGIWLYYCPSLEVSGYGRTKKQALESYNDSMEQFSEDIAEAKLSEKEKELRRLGWIRNKFFKKKYGNVSVDEEGVLQNFDADFAVKQCNNVLEAAY
jgi:hypothetical protein